MTPSSRPQRGTTTSSQSTPRRPSPTLDSSLDPYALAGPGGIALWQLRRFLQRTLPLPDDPVQWLTQQPYLEVVQPEHAVTLAGVTARVADVRAVPSGNGIACPDGAGTCVMPFAHGADVFPMVISSEYVTLCRRLPPSTGTDS